MSKFIIRTTKLERRLAEIFSITSPGFIILSDGTRPWAIGHRTNSRPTIRFPLNYLSTKWGEAQFGEDQQIGKPASSDLREGKVTLLIQKALEKGNSGQRQKILTTLGNLNASQIEVETVRQVVLETGAREYTERKICALGEQARCAAEKVVTDETHRAWLVELVSVLVDQNL